MLKKKHANAAGLLCASVSRHDFFSELASWPWLQAFGALCFMQLASWLLNQFMYPQIASVYGIAREFATVTSAGSSLLIALVFASQPNLIRPKLFMGGALGMFLGGFLLTFPGLTLQSPTLLTLSCIAMSLGRSIIIVLSACVLIRLSAGGCALCVAGSLVLSYVLRGVFVGLSFPWGMYSYAVVTCLSLMLAWPESRKLLESSRIRPSPLVVSVTEPRSFLPFAHVLFLSFFVFRIAHGFSVTFGAIDSIPPFFLAPLIPLAIVALQVLLSKRAAPADMLYQIASIFVLAGFLSLLIPEATNTAVANILLAAGGDCFSVLMYYTLATIGRRNPLGALTVFAWGQCATSSGMVAGAVLGHLMNGLLLGSPASVPSAVALMILAFFVFNLTALRSFGFERTIAGIEAPPASFTHTSALKVHESLRELSQSDGASKPAARESGEDYLGQQCARLAHDFSLTEREGEVFCLLARGRNVPFIEEELIISRNTIKTHVKHLYQKMNLHSQQELIDMVETY